MRLIERAVAPDMLAAAARRHGRVPSRRSAIAMAGADVPIVEQTAAILEERGDPPLDPALLAGLVAAPVDARVRRLSGARRPVARRPAHRGDDRRDHGSARPIDPAATGARGHSVGRLVRLEAPRQVSIVEYEDPPLPRDGVRIATLLSGISAGHRDDRSSPAPTRPPTSAGTASAGSSSTAKRARPYPIDGLGLRGGRPGGRGRTGTPPESSVGDVGRTGSWGHRSEPRGRAPSGRRPGSCPPAADPIDRRVLPHRGGRGHRRARRGAAGRRRRRRVRPGRARTAGHPAPRHRRRHRGRRRRDPSAARPGAPVRRRSCRRLRRHRRPPRRSRTSPTVAAPTSRSRSAAPTGGCTRRFARRPTTPGSSASGFPQGAGADLFLGEEFHHNRIALVCSQISGSNPELDHRWNAARLERTVVGLAAAGRIDVASLVTHPFPVTEAASRVRDARRVARGGPPGGARLHGRIVMSARLSGAPAARRLAPAERWDNRPPRRLRRDRAARPPATSPCASACPNCAKPRRRRRVLQRVRGDAPLRRRLRPRPAPRTRSSNVKSQLSVIAELGGAGVVHPRGVRDVHPQAAAVQRRRRGPRRRMPRCSSPALAELGEHAAAEGVAVLLRAAQPLRGPHGQSPRPGAPVLVPGRGQRRASSSSSTCTT